jgi:hypothetical protein
MLETYIIIVRNKGLNLDEKKGFNRRNPGIKQLINEN